MKKIYKFKRERAMMYKNLTLNKTFDSGKAIVGGDVAFIRRSFIYYKELLNK